MPELQLSRRERQIMDILYRSGKATAAEVLEALPDAPSYSAVRALLKTFFDNSAEQAVAALLAIKGEKMSEAELDRMSKLIDSAKKEGR